MSNFNFEKAFLVDDDVVAKVLMINILRTIGFTGEIHEFENGAKALGQIQKLVFQVPTNATNLILLDINMPVLDGWGFLDVITTFPEAWKKRQFISMVTSSIEGINKSKAMSYSVVKGFIHKPVSIQLVKDFSSSHNLYEERTQKQMGVSGLFHVGIN